MRRQARPPPKWGGYLQATPALVSMEAAMRLTLVQPPNGVFDLYPWIDYVVTGEGEAALVSLLRHLRGRAGLGDLVNVAHRGGLGIGLQRVLKPLDNLGRLPFPAYHLVDLAQYFEANPRRL